MNHQANAIAGNPQPGVEAEKVLELAAKIELRPIIAEAGKWNAGKVVRGEREIVVSGRAWGSVKMRGRGCHGTAWEFYGLTGIGIPARFWNARKSAWQISEHNVEKVAGFSKRDWKNKGDTRSTDERIVAKAAELILTGRLRDPEVLAAEARASNEAWRKNRAEEAERKAAIRNALEEIASRADLTNFERDGLGAAYREIFGEEMPK